MQVLKLVRVTSGLRASVYLIGVGHLQESGVLLRSVDEAIRDIQVLDEAHHAQTGAAEYQQRMVDEFFQDDRERFEAAMSGGATGVSRVPKRKKLAATERRLRPAAGTEPVRQMLEAISLVLDGYTHCGYAQTMELYDGLQFRMRGVESPEVRQTFSSFVSLLTVPALHCAAEAIRATDAFAAERLMECSHRLQASTDEVS